MKTLTQTTLEALCAAGAVALLVVAFAASFSVGWNVRADSQPQSTPQQKKCRCDGCECAAPKVPPEAPKTPATVKQTDPVPPTVFPAGHPVPGGVYRIVNGAYVPVSSSSHFVDTSKMVSPCSGGVCNVPRR